MYCYRCGYDCHPNTICPVSHSYHILPNPSDLARALNVYSGPPENFVGPFSTSTVASRKHSFLQYPPKSCSPLISPEISSQVLVSPSAVTGRRSSPSTSTLTMPTPMLPAPMLIPVSQHPAISTALISEEVSPASPVQPAITRQVLRSASQHSHLPLTTIAPAASPPQVMQPPKPANESVSRVLCRSCHPYRYIDAALLVEHQRGYHGLDEHNAHVCGQCGRLFNTSIELKRHIAKHDGVVYPCKNCGKNYTTEYNLLRHIKSAVCSRFPR